MTLAILWLLFVVIGMGVYMFGMWKLDQRRDLMARRRHRDVLPPPSPNCERRGSVVEFRRANGVAK